MTEIILIIFSNILFLCLGFWAGMLKAGQAIPRLTIGKSKPITEEDPYLKAMEEPEIERKETVE